MDAEGKIHDEEVAARRVVSTEAATARGVLAEEASRQASSLKPSLSTAGMYVLAIVTVFALAIFAAIVAPARAVEIMAFSGSLIVALLAILKGQVEVHTAVNSKMDVLLKLVAESERAKGVLEGKEDRK